MDIEPYLRTLRLREQELHAERSRRAAELRARLPELVRILVDEFHVHRVVLFGSLRSGELRDRSDIDLAVGGLAPERYFAAVARLSEAAGIPVDVVPIEEARPSVQKRIEEDGELLHG